MTGFRIRGGRTGSRDVALLLKSKGVKRRKGRHLGGNAPLMRPKRLLASFHGAVDDGVHNFLVEVLGLVYPPLAFDLSGEGA